MSVYECYGCGQFIDGDYAPCEEVNDKLICPDCFEEKEIEKEIFESMLEFATKSLSPHKFNTFLNIVHELAEIRHVSIKDSSTLPPE